MLIGKKQDDALRLLFGLGGTDIVLTVIRIFTGLFFVFSGYHKLFNQDWHKILVQTLKADRMRSKRSADLRLERKTRRCAMSAIGT